MHHYTSELDELARGENDDDILLAVKVGAQAVEMEVAGLEVRRMFSNPPTPTTALSIFRPVPTDFCFTTTPPA